MMHEQAGMIGQTISHYAILEKLGEGGMGVVYKARDVVLERIVALKFLPEQISSSPVDRDRFLQEARAAAALNHPNICTIHGIEEGGGRHFLVMEFVDGLTLQEKKTSLSMKQAIEISIQIAEGLAVAHEKGIVHRDIKPENIMVRKDGITQIMDFGLAKLQGTSRLTREGSTIGTVGYMSPEQVQGFEVDHRSDIFSLGVVMYEMLCGRHPFSGVHETALMYEIVNVNPSPPSSVKQEIDPALEAMIMECLEKDPHERTQSARQLAVDLRRFKRESGDRRVTRVTAAGQGPIQQLSLKAQPQRNVLWPVISGVLVVALGLTAWMLWNATHAGQPVTRLSISLPEGQSILTGNYGAIAISADGSCIVYAANGKLYQRRLNSFTPEEIPETDDGSSPFFSPDGRSVGFFANGKLKKTALSGGVPVTLADRVPNSRGGTWLRDGTIVFAGSTAGLFRVNAEGGDVTTLTFLDSLQSERTHRWPQCLPDGKTVIFTIGTMDSPDYYEDATIGAVNIKTGERKTLLKGASKAEFASAGYLLYSRSGSLFAAPFDLDHLQIAGASFPVVDNLSGDQMTGAMNYAVSGSGTLVWVPGQTGTGNRELALADLGGRISPLPLRPGPYLEPRMSPDSKNVALVIGSGKDYDVWIYNIPNNTMNRLTFGGANRSPVWSPDGRRIAYSHNSPDRPSVIIMQSDGTGPVDQIPTESRTYVNCWSRDGSTLLLSVPSATAGWALYTLPLKGERKIHPLLETKFTAMQASISPDGKWYSYVERESGTGQIIVRPFPAGDGKWQVSTGEAHEAHWSPDGRALYYSGPQTITAVPLDGSRSFTMGRPHIVLGGIPWLSAESASTFDITPDGMHILITKAVQGDDMPRQINVVVNWFGELHANSTTGK